MGLKSFFLLGTQFFLHFFLKLFHLRRRYGVERFLDNYRPDHIRPLSPHERRLLATWQRCTNCGLCEAACPLDTPDTVSEGPTFAVLAAAIWRDLTAHRVVRVHLQALVACDACTDCEAVCPEEIPLRELARMVAQA